MNGLSLLKQDHVTVDTLFTRFERLGADDAQERRQVVDQIIEHLSVHAAIEEQVFYPAVRAAVESATDQVLEGLEEHHVLKWTLHELETLAPTDERFAAKVRVLIENVRHHASE